MFQQDGQFDPIYPEMAETGQYFAANVAIISLLAN